MKNYCDFLKQKLTKKFATLSAPAVVDDEESHKFNFKSA